MCIQVGMCGLPVHAGSISVILSLHQYVQKVELVLTFHLLGELDARVDLVEV